MLRRYWILFLLAGILAAAGAVHGILELANRNSPASQAGVNPSPPLLSAPTVVVAEAAQPPRREAPRPKAKPVVEKHASAAADDSNRKPDAESVEPFRFPADAAGKLLAKTLTPSQELTPFPLHDPPAPVPLLAPAAIEEPVLELLPLQTDLSPPPFKPPACAYRPWMLPDDPPFTHYRTELEVPQAMALPCAACVRLPDVNVETPTPLPLIGDTRPDRASLDDPTNEESHAAVLVSVTPERAAPSPFSRVSVPEPFENHADGRLRELPAEDQMPAMAGPPLPGR